MVCNLLGSTCLGKCLADAGVSLLCLNDCWKEVGVDIVRHATWRTACILIIIILLAKLAACRFFIMA